MPAAYVFLGEAEHSLPPCARLHAPGAHDCHAASQVLLGGAVHSLGALHAHHQLAKVRVCDLPLYQHPVLHPVLQGGTHLVRCTPSTSSPKSTASLPARPASSAASFTTFASSAPEKPGAVKANDCGDDQLIKLPVKWQKLETQILPELAARCLTSLSCRIDSGRDCCHTMLQPLPSSRTTCDLST
jgi:hypothetical protein